MGGWNGMPARRVRLLLGCGDHGKKRCCRTRTPRRWRASRCNWTYECGSVGEPSMIEARRMVSGALVRRYWHGMPLLICNGLLKERRGMRSYSQLCASRRRRRQNAGMEWNASTESAATPWLRRSRKKAVLPHAHSKTLARGSVQLDLRMRCPGRTVYDRGAADGVSNVADQIGNWVWREGVGDQQGPESRRR